MWASVLKTRTACRLSSQVDAGVWEGMPDTYLAKSQKCIRQSTVPTHCEDGVKMATRRPLPDQRTVGLPRGDL